MGAQIDLQLGDCLDVMRDLPAESVDAIVTDPPYGLAFMGKAWDHAVPGPEFFAEMLRVAKPGAHLFAFGGSRLYHRMTCAIEDAGWVVRDCLSWLYGSGFPKSLDVAKAIDRKSGIWRGRAGAVMVTQGHSKGAEYVRGDKGEPVVALARKFNGYGTALKPAWEPIVLGMKPTDGTFAQNAERHGVAGLNIDAGRVEDARWPANLVLDEAAGALLDETVGELKSGDAPKRRSADKFARGTYGDFKGQAECPPGRSANKGGPSRFFYCAKASRKDRGEGNIHPTVKPGSLMNWLVKLAAPPGGGVILDPFMGSGSTGAACARLGVDFIGIERDPEYLEIARGRIASAGNEAEVEREKESREPTLFDALESQESA